MPHPLDMVAHTKNSPHRTHKKHRQQMPSFLGHAKTILGEGGYRTTAGGRSKHPTTLHPDITCQCPPPLCTCNKQVLLMWVEAHTNIPQLLFIWLDGITTPPQNFLHNHHLGNKQMKNSTRLAYPQPGTTPHTHIHTCNTRT